MLLFLKVFFTEFIAEMGDKTQLMLIALTSKYKLKDIIMGTAAAILVLNGLAVLAGGLVSEFIPEWLIKIVAAFAFLYFAASTLAGDEDEEEEEGGKSKIKFAPLAVFCTFFVAELGDKTQLTAITFGANEGMGAAFIVWIGCSLGLFLADILGMLVGYLLKSKTPDGLLNTLAFVIFAMENPKPNFMLLDRFLIMMEQSDVPAVICFNKKDLASEQEVTELYETYKNCGYHVILASALEKEGLEEIHEILKGKTTVVAGPSGVGKSSLTNLLQGEVQMETGEISKKLKRGRHTTRHSQVIPVGEDTFLMDTPGFSSLYLTDMEEQDLKDYFPEFRKYDEECRFQGCRHIHEPGCRVKEAFERLDEYVFHV